MPQDEQIEDTRHFLPLLIDMRDREVFIFGSGAVGERKTRLFCEYAPVTVVSLGFSHSFFELEKKNGVILIAKDVERLSDKQIKEMLGKAFLVIPATNSKQLNRRIASLASSLGIFTNEVDSAGDVTIPSIIKRGDLTISISTAGASPAFSRYTRQRIEKVITPQFTEMIRIQDEIRTYLKEVVADQRYRKEILWEILQNDDVWQDLEVSYEKGYKTAQDIVKDKISKKVR